MTKKTEKKSAEYTNEHTAEYVDRFKGTPTKSGTVACTMLIDKRDMATIVETMKALFPNDKIGQESTSCKQQVAWYRSQLKRGLLAMVGGQMLNLKSKKHVGHELRGKNNLEAPVADEPKAKATKKASKKRELQTA